MNHTKKAEEKIIEVAERIVIEYANWSGRADNRPQFREAVIKALHQYRAEVIEACIEAAKDCRYLCPSHELEKADPEFCKDCAEAVGSNQMLNESIKSLNTLKENG